MVLQKDLSTLLHTIVSVGVLTPLNKLNSLMTYDYKEEALQARKRRESLRRQELRKISTLKQLDASHLPLVATDRSAFERAILEAGDAASISNQSKSPIRKNGSNSKQKIHTATKMHFEWNDNAFAAAFRFNNKETIS